MTRHKLTFGRRPSANWQELNPIELPLGVLSDDARTQAAVESIQATYRGKKVREGRARTFGVFSRSAGSEDGAVAKEDAKRVKALEQTVGELRAELHELQQAVKALRASP